jgi:hypothetical protein
MHSIIATMSSKENDEKESSDSSTTNNNAVNAEILDEAVVAPDADAVGVVATERDIMTPDEAAEAAKVRMKAHVLLAKVEQSEAKRSPSLANTPRESTTDLTQHDAGGEANATATTTVDDAAGKLGESTAAAAETNAEVEVDEAATLAEAKLKKEKEIEDKKNESSEELTKRLQKLALERQKETRHERLKVIQSDQTSHLSSAKTFQELKLPDHLLKAIFEMGFERPSAIQEEALPRILANPPRNVIGQAQSGSGKTAAFVLGMLYRIKIDKPATCQALCVTPTRELAVQIFQNAVTPMAAHMVGLRIRLALAGETLERGDKVDAHIVIGTPGKVVDWLKRRMINTKTIKVFVLDEADNMVAESGHRANSLLIKNQMPKSCQCLLFSATFPDEVIAFAEKLVYNPDKILIESGPEFLVSFVHGNGVKSVLCSESILNRSYILYFNDRSWMSSNNCGSIVNNMVAANSSFWKTSTPYLPLDNPSSSSVRSEMPTLSIAHYRTRDTLVHCFIVEWIMTSVIERWRHFERWSRTFSSLPMSWLEEWMWIMFVLW